MSKFLDSSGVQYLWDKIKQELKNNELPIRVFTVIKDENNDKDYSIYEIDVQQSLMQDTTISEDISFDDFKQAIDDFINKKIDIYFTKDDISIISKLYCISHEIYYEEYAAKVQICLLNATLLFTNINIEYIKSESESYNDSSCQISLSDIIIPEIPDFSDMPQ